MLAPFEAPRLKIARARRHIEELRAAVTEYLSRNPVQLVVERWPHMPGTSAWTIRIREPVPVGLSVIIGDVVHNLRTALDLLANDLVRKRDMSTKGVYFPFAASEVALNARIKEKNFDRAGQEAVQLLKAIRPFRGGNDGLRGLHDLDVADKHQALVPVLSTAVLDLHHIVPGADEGTKNKLKQWSTAIEHDGQHVLIIPDGWGPRQGTVIKADYVLWTRLSSGGDKAGGYEVIWLMDEFARIVEGVIVEFEKIAGK